MRTVVITRYPEPDLAERWIASLAEMPYATSYVSPNYFTDPYAGDDRFAVLAKDDDDNIAAILTGVRIGSNVVSGGFSRPQIVFRDDSSARLLLDGLQGLVNSHGVTEAYSWQKLPSMNEAGFQESESGSETSVVMLDLRRGPDKIFAGFSQTRRNELRKAIKKDSVKVKEIETEAELAELYQIYRDWNKRKGTAADTFEKMQQARAMRESRRIFIATVDGQVIAGSFYRFYPGGVVEYAANFSLPEYQHLRPNDLIGWHAIQWACETSCKYFSMGGSHLFLRRFGGDVIDTFRYRQDNRPLRLNGIKENAREVGAAAFRRLPANVKAGVRRVLAR
jgi:hypothetical protein